MDTAALDQNSKINEDEEDNVPLLKESEDVEQTQLEVIDAPFNKLPQCLASFSATIGAFCVGTCLAWISPTEERLKNGALGFKMTESEISWAGSLVGLGAAVACPVAGVFVDKIGRRNTMVAMTLPFSLGWAFVAFAVNLPMLYAGRILTGACAGIFSVGTTIYVTEIAHPKSRGFLGSFFQLQICLGLEFTYLIGPKISVFWLSVASGILPLVNCLFLLTLAPESPVYLLRNGRLNAAYSSLIWLRGSQYDPNPELNSITDSNPVNAASWSSFLSMLFKRPMVVACSLMAFQQFSGINDVIFYTEEIFRDAGGSVQGSDAAAIVGGVQFGATVVSSMVVDKAGRRMLLMISGAVMAACCTALGLYFQLRTWGHDVTGLAWLPLSSLCLYFSFFSLGFGPIPWIMLGELFAPDVRGVAGAVVSSLSWILTFLVTFVFADVVSLIGEGVTFWIFAGMCVVGVLFVALFVPETKGKSLAEIQRELGLTHI